MPDAVPVVFSPESQRDLLDIKDYITNDLGSPRAASRTLERILDSIEVLKRFPESGASLAGHIGFECDYRFIVSGSYLIFYHTDDERAFVDRILNGRMNYLHVLGLS